MYRRPRWTTSARTASTASAAENAIATGRPPSRRACNAPCASAPTCAGPAATRTAAAAASGPTRSPRRRLRARSPRRSATAGPRPRPPAASCAAVAPDGVHLRRARRGDLPEHEDAVVAQHAPDLAQDPAEPRIVPGAQQVRRDHDADRTVSERQAFGAASQRANPQLGHAAGAQRRSAAQHHERRVFKLRGVAQQPRQQRRIGPEHEQAVVAVQRQQARELRGRRVFKQ